MAEALCKFHISEVSPALIDGWKVASAGCWAYPGMPATTKAIAAAEAKGAELNDHSSQPVTLELLDDFELILCMEQGHVDFIKRHFPETDRKVFLLSEMIGDTFEIDDPVGSTQSDYMTTAEKIYSIIKLGWQRIKELSSE